MFLLCRPPTRSTLAALLLTWLAPGHAHAEPPVSASIGASTNETYDAERVRRLDREHGFLFAPSTPKLSAFRLGVGLLHDAIDPQVIYGAVLRTPQLTLDARYGLGRGFSLKGHFNSMLVTTELLLGAAYAWRHHQLSFELSASVGLFFGQLSQFDFDTNLYSPEYRPELALAYDFGDVKVLLRGSVLLMGPERARVGELWGGLDNSHFFVGHSEMLIVEDAQSSGGIWFFGLGAMTTRAYYQLWLLFPDSPALFTYLRTMVGYEF